MMETSQNPGNREKLEALTQTANDLVAGVNALNAGTGVKVASLSTRIRRNQKVLWIVIASVVLDIAVTLVVTFTVVNTRENTDKLNDLTARLNYSQNVSRKQALCPLFKIFVDSKSDAGRKAYPQGVKEYDRLFGIIEGSYRSLQCDSADLKPLAPR